VLPGVSAEASSPVLIEKVRTGISDSTGLYRIPDLPPRIWFYNNIRSYGNHQEIPGLFGNRNAGAQSTWFYDKDEGVTARGAAAKMIEAIRLTGQATPRNKVGFYLDYQNVCNGSAYQKGAEQCRDRGDDWIAIGSVGAGFFGALAPEAGNVWDNREKITQFTWTSPFTSKLLLEAGFSQFASRFGGQIPGGALTNFIPVQEQSTLGGTPVGNFTYRGWASAGSNEQFHTVWRASGTYVTGAHSLKVGYQAAFQVQKNFQNAGSQLSYVFNNRTPIQFTMRDTPFWQSNRTRFDAIYVQDQWTRGRLTLQGGLRYEHAWSWFPEGENGVVQDNQFGSTFLFPELDGVTGYHDITPRMGAAYDLFGNGKTSIKVNYSKYLQAANNDAQYTIANPAVTFQQTTNRSWTDSNGNFVVDCVLMNRVAEDNRPTGGDVWYWHGVDVSVNARTSNGITFQGGTSTGRGVRDYCAITDALPELFVTVGSVLANAQKSACAISESWLTTFRSSVTYTIPRIDVLVAGSIRSTPNTVPSTINTFVATNGGSIAANYNVTSQILQGSSIGRPLVPGLAFQTVDLALPGQVYPDRINSVDMRVAKVLRFRGYRADVGFDFYNLFNANTGTAFNQVYDVVSNGASWLRPTTVLNPRFARFNFTLNF
jgi:hypothetical protein